MSDCIGLDFGTTNCVVAALLEDTAGPRLRIVPSRLGEDRTPSAVAVDRRGEWLFGAPAREADTPAKVLSVKRWLGEGRRFELGGWSLPPEALAALLLRHLAEVTAERLGEPLRRAVLTVPANSKGLQRASTKAAAAAAGIQTLNLINEPTAAAMAYGLGAASHRADRRILVYDFGGGTFDVTVLRAHHGLFEELASRGLRHCGGDDLDQSLADWLLTERLGPARPPLAPWPALRLKLACEAAKIALGERPLSRVDLEDIHPGVSLHAEVGRELLENLARPLLERTAEPVRQALADARLLPGDLDHVLLVGGTSRMPAVRDFVENLLGRAAEPFSVADPLTCVAQGAAVVAGLLQGAAGLADVDYQVCLEHSLCTEPVDPLTGRRYLEPIIDHGTKIPNRNTRTYYPVADYSAEVIVSIFEGNDYDQPTSAENVRLGAVKVPLEPRRKSEDCPIEVEFAYSEDGLLTATARDLTQRREFSGVIDYLGGRLAPADLAELDRLQTEIFGSPAPEPTSARRETPPATVGPAHERQRRLDRVERVLALAPADETALLRELAAELRALLAANAPAEVVAEADRKLAAELLFFEYLLC